MKRQILILSELMIWLIFGQQTSCRLGRSRSGKLHFRWFDQRDPESKMGTTKPAAETEIQQNITKLR